MAVTIKEVAKRANLSVGAVSQALNGTGKLTDATRKRAAQAAAELGYIPSAYARATRRGRMGAFALLGSTDGRRSYLPLGLLHGIVSEMNRRDLHLVVATLPDERLTNEGFVPKVLREWMVDGLIINYQLQTPPRMAAIMERHQIPSVWVNSRQASDSVYVDELDAGRRAAEVLLRAGHRNIAYVDFSNGVEQLPEAHYSVHDRAAGCAEAVRLAGGHVEVVRGPGRTVPYDRRVGAALSLLRRPDRPTAAVLYSGAYGIQIALAAAELGMSVPRDLSLASLGHPISAEIGKKITGLDLPLGEMGRQAVDMLERKVSAPAEKLPSRAIRCRLVEGETVLPPRLRPTSAAEDDGRRKAGDRR